MQCSLCWVSRVRIRAHYAAERTKFYTSYSISNHASTLWKIVLAIGGPGASMFGAFLCWAACLSSFRGDHFSIISTLPQSLREKPLVVVSQDGESRRETFTFPLKVPFSISNKHELNPPRHLFTAGQPGSTPSDEPTKGAHWHSSLSLPNFYMKFLHLMTN